MQRKKRSNGDYGGLLLPTPMHSSTCWCSVQLPLWLIKQERLLILIFSRLQPFCVFEIVLWVFGLEGGLAGRPLLLLLGSSEMRASVPSWPIRVPSIVYHYHYHCFLVLCGPGGQRGGFWESQSYQ